MGRFTWIDIFLGGSIAMGVSKMVGLFQGKSHLQMDDDWGYPYFRKPPSIPINYQYITTDYRYIQRNYRYIPINYKYIPTNYRCGGFLKWGTPKSSILMGCSLTKTNHFRVPPFMEIPILTYIYYRYHPLINPF